MDTKESWMVVLSPETNHSKYFPEVTTDQSNWYLNNPRLPLFEVQNFQSANLFLIFYHPGINIFFGAMLDKTPDTGYWILDTRL